LRCLGRKFKVVLEKCAPIIGRKNQFVVVDAANRAEIGERRDQAYAGRVAAERIRGGSGDFRWDTGVWRRDKIGHDISPFAG